MNNHFDKMRADTFALAKIVADRIKYRFTNTKLVLSLAGALVFSPLLATSYVSVQERQIQAYGIESAAPQNDYAWMKFKIGDFMGKGQDVIYEFLDPVERITDIIGKYTVSFHTTDMPKDMEAFLKKYPTGDDYGDYAQYVKQNVDWIVLCPQIKPLIRDRGFYIAEIITMNYLDEYIYPDSSVMYVCFLYDKDKLSLASNFIHGVAHKEMARLLNDTRDQNKSERHARIKEYEFYKLLSADYPTYGDEHQYIQNDMNYALKCVEELNLTLGLNKNDLSCHNRAEFIIVPTSLSTDDVCCFTEHGSCNTREV